MVLSDAPDESSIWKKENYPEVFKKKTGQYYQNPQKYRMLQNLNQHKGHNDSDHANQIDNNKAPQMDGLEVFFQRITVLRSQMLAYFSSAHIRRERV